MGGWTRSHLDGGLGSLVLHLELDDLALFGLLLGVELGKLLLDTVDLVLDEIETLRHVRLGLGPLLGNEGGADELVDLRIPLELGELLYTGAGEVSR
jgi:hypothetical protein